MENRNRIVAVIKLSVLLLFIIGLPLLLLALVIQALTALFLMRTAGRVYKMMLLYRGGVPKPAQIIRMLKENKAAEKAAAGKEAPHAE